MAIYWGFVEGHHDASLVVLKNGDIAHQSSASTYSGIPRDPWLHPNQIQDALTHGKPDHKYFYENPVRSNWRRIKERRPTIWPSMMANFGNHHLSHAASAWYTSEGMDDAIIIVADAVGELESLVVYRAEGYYISDPLFTLDYPHSPGLFYSNVTAKCGLKANSQEGILTKWSLQGKNILMDLYRGHLIDGIHFIALENYNKKPPHLYSRELAYDAAYTAQLILENYITNLAVYYRNALGIKNLVFTGGVAYNALLRYRLEELFDRVYVPTNPGDGGSALGAIIQHMLPLKEYTQ